MPYASRRELPKAVKELSEHEQEIWRKAFNAAFDRYHEEGRAAATAWAAVNKSKGTEDSMPNLHFAEHTFFDKASLRVTRDGYLVAPARIARTGVQNYRGEEVGDAQHRPLVRVYRPPEEVFHRDSLASLAHRPVTLNHPTELVNADNWKDHAVGHVDGEVIRDGDMVRVNMLICDSAAIEAVRKGHSQLSVGYDSELDWTPGTTPAGEPYDCAQRKIRGNHVALTPSARGGPLLRLGDKETDMPGIEREPMLRTITVDGIELKLPEMTALIVDRALGDVAKLRKDNETLTGTVAALTKQVADSAVSDTDLDKRVAERQSVIALARRVIGDAYKPEGRSLIDIRRDTVAHKLGDAAKSLTDEGVAGAFAVVTAGIAGSTPATTLGDGPRELAMNLSRPTNQPGTGGDVEAAFEERGRYVREAWRGGGNAAGARLPQQH